MLATPLPDHVHVDARWVEGGIGRFASHVLPAVTGGGRRLTGRCTRGVWQGQLEMSARFTPLARGGGIFFSPGFAPPLGWEHRSVVTVHDLHYLDRTIASARQRWYFGEVMLRQFRRCRRVLTVSTAFAEQIAEVLGPDAPDVVVVGNGVDAALLEVEPDRVSRVPQLLFVGGDKPNKNLVVALQAFALAQRSGIAACAELAVVGHVAAPIRSTAPPGVRFVGAVSDPELAQLYAQSTALLMPSISEGFGLPALEAMVAGTPVIYGNRDALAEVVGHLGWPVDPFDVESVATGIDASLAAPMEISTSQREELADRHRWSDVAARVGRAVMEVL